MEWRRGIRAGGGRPIRLATVLPLPGRLHRGLLRFAGRTVPCVLGRSGVTRLKREGDGATPAGRHRLVALKVRRDRLPGPPTAIPAAAIGRRDGWCDDPGSGRYNAPLRLPSAASHERLWREDAVYDIVGVLDWNLQARVRRRGSAIFLHLARPDLAPTEGCIALRRADLLRLLADAAPDLSFAVADKPRKRRPQGRGPKTALPTRTWVAPKRIAVS